MENQYFYITEHNYQRILYQINYDTQVVVVVTNKIPNFLYKNFPNANTLYLKNQGIYNIPEEFNPDKLKKIFCQSNNITNILSIKKYSNLNVLSCSNNFIKSINSLSSLLYLNYLNISFNNISCIRSLQNCKNLIKLNCSHNLISDVSCLKELKQLKFLNCSNNNISDINPLYDCTELVTLIVSDNKLKNLGLVMYHSKLQKLEFTNNPIEKTIQSHILKPVNIDFLNRKIINISDRMKTKICNYNLCTPSQKIVYEFIDKILSPEYIISTKYGNDFNFDCVSKTNLDDDVIEFIYKYYESKCIHHHYGLSFRDLLPYLWNAVLNSPYILFIIPTINLRIKQNFMIHQCLNYLINIFVVSILNPIID